MTQLTSCDQDAEVLLQTLLGEMQDVGLMTWTQDGQITMLSERCRELMQLPDTASVGESIALVAESPCHEFMPVYEAFRQSRHKNSLEQEFELHAGAETYWLKLSVRRCPKGCGEISAFLMIVRDITLQRISQEQARRTQGYFEAALRAIPDAAVFADTEGRITKVSVGAERIFGYQEEELLGKPIDGLANELYWREASPGRDGAGLTPLFKLVEFFDKAGHRFSAEALTDWIQDEDGRQLGSVAILRDVSERIDLQEDLLQQTLLLDSIFRQHPFALSVIDTERHFVQVSDAALELFGYRQEQMANHLTRMIYASDDEYERVGKAKYQDSPTEPVVAQLVDANDRQFWARVQVAPLYSSEKQLRGYLMTVEDVTESLAYEEELRRYEQMVSASNDALIFIDRRHVYLAANEAYLQLWGRSRDEVIGAHLADVVGDGLYLEYVRPALKRCFQGEVVVSEAIDVDFPAGERVIDVRHTPYRDERGEVAGVLITLRDVTQQHHVQRSMLESQLRFEQAGEFAEFAVWELDVESRVPVDDTMLRRLLGYGADDVFDSLDAWLNLVPEPDRQRMIESFERLLSGLENVERLECRAIKKDGQEVHVETLIEGKYKHGVRRLVGISRDVTALVHEREELHQYEHMVQVTQDGLALVDREHVYQAVNDYYTAQYGLEPAAIIGQKVPAIIGEELYSQLDKQQLERCFQGARIILERWIEYPVSGRRRVELTFSPYRDEAGDLSRVLVTSHDITERYLSQMALQDSEEKFRAIFDNAPIGMVILREEDGRILDANPASLHMHGYDRDGYLSLKPWDVVEGLSPDNFQSEWQRVTQRERSRFISKHCRKDGSSLHVLVDASRMQLTGRRVIIATLADITRQKQLELRLREQQRQYRMLIESSSAILYASDPRTFRFSFVSPEAEKLLGYPVSDWLGRDNFWLDHLHPDDREWAPAFSRSMLDQARDHEFDYRMIAADGRTVWLHDLTSVLVEDGRVVSLVGVMVDVTESKSAEQERWRLSEMVRQSADAILLTDIDFNITYINEAFTRLYGYTLEDLRGRRPEILNAETDAEMIQPEIYGDLKVGHRVNRQLLNRRKDGTLFHCLHNITPLSNDRGKVIAYMSSQRDVTQQLQAEQDLRESEEKYRRIVDTAQEGIWVVNTEGVTTFVNPRMAEMLGQSQESMLGQSWFDYVDKGHREEVEALWSRLPDTQNLSRELCFRREGGASLWCHVSITVLQDREEGQMLGAMALLTDISEQRQLTQALIRSQKMEAVGQLTGGIAHDFNNILGSILGFAELTRDRFGALDPKLKDYISHIQVAGGRARDLIRQLLIFSRGENTQSAASIPLVPLVKEIMKMLRPVLPVAIEIRSQFPHLSPYVKVDPLHVQQVLMNLCINARDAIDKSGLITVEVSLRRGIHARCAICGGSIAGTWVAIRVSDTGRGIDESLQDDIFQPFVTSKEVGEGSGMGLAVVRGIVTSYSGHLLVESKTGKGASFEILLPPAPPPTTVSEQDESASEADLDLAGLTVLVVDDEPQYIHYYRELLGDAGARLICCQSGAQALGRYQRDKLEVDLIVSDQAMPGMSGSDLIRYLRELGCQAPAIFCTGYGYDVDEELMRQLGITHRLQKPVDRNDLFASLRKVLGR
jgi:PAS domain S-box-containing protein